ncbi:hypothetical protein [Flammeovirga aprica]|uniref:Uncharacterized protein n=1 Tax=Flammeovirga aprica JL-4 TaxID=694437 RepID=A0A7X9RYI5_9BACT|nr:hypothetical protein [Flammeovirga aprica]NME71063.1 hypothetical protein [Flammeovirga aprica JL-4]
MEEKYTFNKKKLRLEPIHNSKCEFCSKGFSDNMERNLFADIYKVHDKTNLIVYKSIKFDKIKVGIPRCSSCFVNHYENEVKSWVILIIIAVLISILSFFFSTLLGVFLIIPLAFSTYILQTRLRDYLISKAFIFSPSDGTKKDPNLKSLLTNGWTTTPPSF